MILQGALALSLVLSVIFSIQFILLTREARTLSGQLAMANMYQNTVRALAVDCLQYGTKNPAILPMLKTFNLELKQGSQ